MPPEIRSTRQTIAEIAKLAGVSVPTVSKVLNNRPDVATATRARVARVIAEHGYVRSQAARALSRARSGTIDLVATELGSPYILEIIRAVEESLEPTEFRLVLSSMHAESGADDRWLRKLAKGATDGAILVLGKANHLEELRRRAIPFVVVDSRADLEADVPSVSATNWAGGRAATNHLLALGHRRIAIITGRRDFGANIARLAGYHVALEEAGIPRDAQLVRPGNWSVESGMSQAQALLELPDPPTAIFAGNDMQALGVYHALHAHRIGVPEGISVVGFDDLPFAAQLGPPLTTIRQPLEEMGRVATAMLLRLIGKETLDATRIELATSLVRRESCGAPADRVCRGSTPLVSTE